MGVTGLRTVESGRAHVLAMDHLGNKELGEFWRGNAPSGQTVGQELMDFAFSKRSLIFLFMAFSFSVLFLPFPVIP
jgi:hypothetical protein